METVRNLDLPEEMNIPNDWRIEALTKATYTIMGLFTGGLIGGKFGGKEGALLGGILGGALGYAKDSGMTLEDLLYAEDETSAEDTENTWRFK